MNKYYDIISVTLLVGNTISEARLIYQRGGRGGGEGFISYIEWKREGYETNEEDKRKLLTSNT